MALRMAGSANTSPIRTVTRPSAECNGVSVAARLKVIRSPITALEEAETASITRVDSKNQVPHLTEDEELEFDVDGCVDTHDWSNRLVLQNGCMHEPDTIVARCPMRVGPLCRSAS